jgi:cytochrome c oxidase accessory protein FixG
MESRTGPTDEMSAPLEETKPVTLYIKREKIHPKHVVGRFTQLRKGTGYTLLALYFGLPWVQWESHQGILFDLPARRFTLFSLTLWPQDFFYLTLLLLVAAFALFFFTALAGRLWCGYSCPQTVWTDVFIRLEYWIEGDRNQRIKLDKAPMSWHKLRRRLTKHSLWLMVSFVTAYTFVGYFTPITLLTHEVLTLSLGPWEMFWMGFFTFATYLNAGWMREQVCFYMCPYARFQSVLFDPDTLIISYDNKRGEPRGKHKEPSGDCIDCKKCVLVCPTGIDIRDGLQYQCIGCAACIDACDEIMTKIRRPTGLVRYTTENALAKSPTHLLRGRVYLYGALLGISVLALTTALGIRAPMALDIIRDRNTLFREAGNDFIENGYSLKLMNKTQVAQRYSLRAEGLPDIRLRMPLENILVEGGTLLTVPAQIQIPRAQLHNRANSIIITLRDQQGREIREVAKFFGPQPR